MFQVILTTRKNEDEWVKSALHQFKVVRTDPFLRILLALSYTGNLIQAYGNSSSRFLLHMGS